MALGLNAEKGTYVASTWKDGTDDYTPITPDRLNHIEQGVQANSEDVKTLGSAWDSVSPVNSNSPATNIISSTASDTYAFWNAQKPGQYFFNARNTNGQPTNFFTVLNLPAGNGMVNQIGMDGTKLYHRRASSSDSAMPAWT